MSFGPELIWSWSRELSALAGRRVQRVEGGGSAVIISLAGGAELLLSWGAQNCGAAVISARDKKSLLAAARQTPPITNAVKSHLTGAQLVSVAQLAQEGKDVSALIDDLPEPREAASEEGGKCSPASEASEGVGPVCTCECEAV